MRKIVLLLAIVALCGILSALFAPSESSNHCNATSNSTETRDLPIIMYHSVLKSNTGTYTIHPDKFESDITKFLQMGYTPVFMREVIDFVHSDATLPEKPIVITFDDGHYNNLYYALPIIQKHNVKVVISPVTSFSQYSERTGEHSNPNFSYLTAAQLKELQDSGLVEIGNHTHAMHKFRPRYGIGMKSSESIDCYREALRADIAKAQDYIAAAGVTAPTTFVYPFGKYTTESNAVFADLGFKAMLTCNEGISKITQGDPDCLLRLKRYNRSGGICTDQFVRKVFKNTCE
jgi:peptidoglycan/xylan/chitin deacetylase (PgdA/CDA1 family)